MHNTQNCTNIISNEVVITPPPPQPNFQVTKWSQCSRRCDGGVQLRKVECIGSDCSNPPNATRECNIFPCLDMETIPVTAEALPCDTVQHCFNSHGLLLNNQYCSSADIVNNCELTFVTTCVDNKTLISNANVSTCIVPPLLKPLYVDPWSDCEDKQQNRSVNGILETRECTPHSYEYNPINCLIKDKNNECCLSEAVDAGGTCCPDTRPFLSRDDKCCHHVDACGNCDGKGKYVDINGLCCDSYLDAGSVCCNELLDECGVCGGDSSSCKIIGEGFADTIPFPATILESYANYKAWETIGVPLTTTWIENNMNSTTAQRQSVCGNNICEIGERLTCKKDCLPYRRCPSDCSNRGTCITTTGVCDCWTGYIGTDCGKCAWNRTKNTNNDCVLIFDKSSLVVQTADVNIAVIVAISCFVFGFIVAFCLIMIYVFVNKRASNETVWGRQTMMSNILVPGDPRVTIR